MEFLDHRDGVLVAGPELRRDLAAAIRRHQPELVVTGYFGGDLDAAGVSPAYVNSPTTGPAAPSVLDAGADQRVDLPGPHRAAVDGVKYIAGQRDADPPHEVDVSDAVEQAVASLSEHRRYLELLSDDSVEEQARRSSTCRH